MTENLKDTIILPNEETKINNAVIFLHGYGANGKDLIGIGDIWKQNLPNTVFLSPNAPFSCEGNYDAYQWFDLTSIAPEKIGEGLEKAGPYLHNYIENVKAKFSLGDEKIFFSTFSQGSMMAMYHLCKRKRNCGGLLAYSGLLFEDKNFDKNVVSKFPIRIYHGKNDEVIPYDNSIKAFKKFKSLGFDVEYFIQEDLEHGIDNFGIDFGLNFLKKTINI